MIVTAVERKRGRRRVDVFVDGRFALALGTALAAERGIRPGRSLAPDELSSLVEAEARRGAMESALLLVSYRPRSERELRDRLARKQFGPGAIDETVGRMRELGYLDDASFARFWAETRQAARPRSRMLMASELRRRGVSAGDAEGATADISDEEAAYEAASRRLRSVRGLEFQAFRERMGRFLTQRGFSYDIARRTIERCWAEIGDQAARDEFHP